MNQQQLDLAVRTFGRIDVLFNNAAVPRLSVTIRSHPSTACDSYDARLSPGGETLQQEPGDRSAFHVNGADQGTEAADEELDDLNAARETAELSERNPF